MMDESELDVHPLDRDYSQPIRPTARKATSFDDKVRRAGFFTFITGFVTVLLAAIVLGSFRDGGTIEAVGSFLHRGGMFAILIGGSLIILAFRLPAIRARAEARAKAEAEARAQVETETKSDLPQLLGRKPNSQRFMILLLWNVAGFVVIAMGTAACRSIRSQLLFFVINGVLTIACALMVTTAIWQRGFIRAYAVGLLVGLLLNGFSGVIAISGRYGMRDGAFLFLTHLATIQIAGLACAAYVCLLEAPEYRRSTRYRDTSNNAGR